MPHTKHSGNQSSLPWCDIYFFYGERLAIYGGEGSPNSNWSLTRRWMERLVRFLIRVCVIHVLHEFREPRILLPHLGQCAPNSGQSSRSVPTA